MPDEIFSVIGQSQLFSGLDESLLRRIEAVAGKSHIASGQTLFQQGDPADAIWGLLSGRIVESMRSEEGREITVDVIEPGEVFGEVAVLDWGLRRVEAVATADCDLFRIDRRQFLELLQTSPELCFRVFALLCSRVRGTTTALEETALQKFPARLARRLMTLAANNVGGPGTGVENSESVVLSISQSELASMTGVNREAVNRHLRIWEKEGWIRLGRRQIVISDIKRLSDLAAPTEIGNGMAGNSDGREGFPAFHDRSQENASTSALGRSQNVRNVGLVAIVIGDYSRDMMADVAGTLKTLRAGIRAIETAVADTGGTIIGQSGDSIMAEFPDSAAGLRAAKLIQDRTAPRRGAVTVAKKGSSALFRVGVHAGEIIVDGNRYVGPALNVALRLAQYAGPGDVYISAAVQEHVKDERQTELSFLGNHQFAGIDTPVPVYSAHPILRGAILRARFKSLVPPRHRWLLATSAAAAALAGFFFISLQFAEQNFASFDVSESSIVVMPFTFESDEGSVPFISDGLSREIGLRLAAVPGLDISGLSSGDFLSDNLKDLKQIGRALRVAYALKGHVEIKQDEIRIDLALRNTKNNELAWSRTFGSDYSELQRIQDTVVSEIIGFLGVTDVQSRSPGSPGGTLDPDAYRAYLSAAYLANSDGAAARDLYLEALTLDPNFAAAYAGLVNLAFVRSPVFRDSLPETLIEMSAKAVELAPGSARSYLALAQAQIFDQEYEAAKIAIEKALALNASDPLILQQASLIYYFTENYDDYFDLVNRAWRLNPVDPGVGIRYVASLEERDEIDKAKPVLADLRRLYPENNTLRRLDANLAWLSGDYRRSYSILQSAPDGSDPLQGFRLVFEMMVGYTDPAAVPDNSQGISIRRLRQFQLRFDDVLEFYKQAYARSNSALAGVSVSTQLAFMERFGESREFYEALMQDHKNVDTSAFFTPAGQWSNSRAAVVQLWVLSKLGRLEEAAELEQRLLDRIHLAFASGARDRTLYFSEAQIHAIMGRNEQALESLKFGINAIYGRSVYLRQNPLFENLHRDPKFWALVAEVESSLAGIRRDIEALRAKPTN